VFVGIIDLGINNLTSVQRAFSVPLKSTDSLIVIEDDSNVEQPDLIILPGLGSFGAGMTALRERKLIEKIKKWNHEGTKVVGICLGMQLLGSYSEESKGVVGLDLIASRIERLPGNQSERIPHTGWAETDRALDSQPFPSLQSQGDFYFVHSYHLIPVNNDEVLARTPFGSTSFVSGVLSKNILGVQFHPEKSGGKGKSLISEIVQWARSED
jgi:glutamine amidotransferase